ncbi:unnamed protein product [Calicophoron daubneyi]|uniref:Cationic amino acid transporter n=1 Tax=Calicophoron daubneyi TaxID=300641 RepID=A0AAV2TEU8_CALDB
MDSLRIFVSRICRKKALTSDPFSGSHLKGYVNAVDLTVSGVASTLGAGIYVVIGEVVRDSAGPAVVLSFLIAAISSILSGLCFAELVAHVPKNRSVYLGTYAVVGELMAFIAAWNLIFQYTLDTACLAKTWSLNLDGLTGNAISAFLVENLPLNATGLSAHVDPLAFGTTIIVTALLGFCGCELALMNHIFTFVNLVVIFYVSVVGLFASNRKNWSLDPLQALEKGFIQNVGNGGFAPFGVSGILASAATCFYCFIGFHAVSSTGKDVRNPQRSITIATIFCILICFSCYSMVSIVLTLLVPYYSVSRTTPLPEAFARVGWPVAGHIVTVGGLCALSARLLGGLFPLPRVFNRLSSDGLVFRCVGGLNSCTKTRLVAMLLSGVAAGIMAALFNLQDLVDMATIGALLTFALIALFALILRYRHHSEPLHQRTTTSFATKRENVEESSTSTEQQTPISPSAEQHKKLSSSIGLIGYLELSFCPRHSLVGRTPDSRWIGLTNSLLLCMLVLIKLQMGFILTACSGLRYWYKLLCLPSPLNGNVQFGQTANKCRRKLVQGSWITVDTCNQHDTHFALNV